MKTKTADSRSLSIRHTVATLAYRAAKAIRGALLWALQLARRVLKPVGDVLLVLDLAFLQPRAHLRKELRELRREVPDDETAKGRFESHRNGYGTVNGNCGR